jgi:hypothetical protein
MSPILQGLANGSARGYGAFVPLGAAGAFESIASASGTGSSSTITFSSIPSTYQHLQIRALAQSASNGAYQIRFNSDSGTNYVWHNLSGNGTTVTAGGATGQTSSRIGQIPTVLYLGGAIIDIHDYTSTTKNKTVRSFAGTDSNGSGTVTLFSALWLNTSSITSIDLFTGSNFSSDSRFALYGIKGA